MRPTKNENYMEIAEAVSKRSHDAETKVGSLLVNNSNGAIIATGFNGFARGVDDTKLPNTRPDKYKYIVHSEMNLIANCAKNGISMDNCTLYCTLTPCESCMRMLWQCGITNVIAKQKYRDFDKIVNMMDLYVEEETTSEGFIKLNYRPMKYWP
jgi:dCMP deaminase